MLSLDDSKIFERIIHRNQWSKFFIFFFLMYYIIIILILYILIIKTKKIIFGIFKTILFLIKNLETFIFCLIH